MLIARRFMLPLLLAVAAGVAWFGADRLATRDVSAADNRPVSELDTPLASVLRVAPFVTDSMQAQLMAETLAGVPRTENDLACSVVMLDGEIVHSDQPDTPLVPAFAQLAMTGYAALEVLGREHRFETRLSADADVTVDGVLPGSLYLVGGGDPVLMSYGHSFSFRPVLSVRTPIEDLVDAVVEAGITEIEGSVVAVARRYEDAQTFPVRSDNELEGLMIGRVGALQLDDGLALRGSANNGLAVPAFDAAAAAADRFTELLAARGVSVQGASRVAGADTVIDFDPLAVVSSPPLAEIVGQMLAANDASAAEMLLREVGLVGAGEGNPLSGGRVVREAVEALGATLDVAPRDGSGIDPVGTLTCVQLASFVAAIDSGHPFVEALPDHDLPGVFGGAFGDTEVGAELGLVGGVVYDAAGFVSRTVGPQRQVVIAAIVNRPDGIDEKDTEFLQSFLGLVDPLIEAAPNVALDEPGGS